MGFARGPRAWWPLALLALLAGIVVGVPAVAQSPSAGPVNGAATLERALAGLGELDSYRLENRGTSTLTGDRELTTTAVVVNAPAPAYQLEIAEGGEVGLEWIATQEDGWIRIYGGPFRSQGDDGWSIQDMDPVTVALTTLQRMVSEGLVTELVGPETIDGRATTHYRAHTIDPLISPPPDAYYRRTMTGTMDLWVDAAQGFLVRSKLDVIQKDDLSSGFRIGEIHTRETATVSAVNDAGNVVEAPDLALATRPPYVGGDPALAAVVQRAIEALREHDSYVITTVGETMGSSTRSETTIVRRPVEAVQEVTSAFGREFFAVIRIGDQEWTRGGGEGDWIQSPFQDATCDSEPCAIGSGLNLDELVVKQADTYELVDDTELLDGIPVLHVRSTAGSESADLGWIPGTMDLWIAKDGGHLLRMTTDGQGTSSTTDITHIDDPANRIEAPASVMPTEPA